MALTNDSSVITAISNDYGYENIFERQISGLSKKGDVFIGLTTSGTSTNIIKAFKDNVFDMLYKYNKIINFLKIICFETNLVNYLSESC